LVYGSAAYGVSCNDLDICMIVDDYSLDELQDFKKLVIDFHANNALQLDDEVPYDNKLIYTNAECEEMLHNSPFVFKDGMYKISPIVKKTEFLGSKEMKHRLLLNILTTRSILIAGDNDVIVKYRKAAWELLVKVIINYSKLNAFDLSEIHENLMKDKYRGVEGELFLGYKANIKDRTDDLAMNLRDTLEILRDEGKIHSIRQGRYRANEQWLHKMIK